MEIKFNIILTMHINICQYRTKLPHALKVKIMNLLAVNLLNKIYSYFGAIGAADTSIHMQGKQLFIVHAAFLSQYLECLLNVAQSCTSYPKLVRGRAILQCNSLDSS